MTKSRWRFLLPFLFLSTKQQTQTRRARSSIQPCLPLRREKENCRRSLDVALSQRNIETGKRKNKNKKKEKERNDSSESQSLPFHPQPEQPGAPFSFFFFLSLIHYCFKVYGHATITAASASMAI